MSDQRIIATHLYTAHACTHKNRNMAICAQAQKEKKKMQFQERPKTAKKWQKTTLSCGKKGA